MDPSLRHQFLALQWTLGSRDSEGPQAREVAQDVAMGDSPTTSLILWRAACLAGFAWIRWISLGNLLDETSKRAEWLKLTWKRRKPKENANWTLNSPPALATPFEPKRMAESSCSARLLSHLWFFVKRFYQIDSSPQFASQMNPKSTQRSGTQATEWDILQCPCICTSCNNLLLVSFSPRHQPNISST